MFCLISSAVQEVMNSRNSELLVASLVDIDATGLPSTSSGRPIDLLDLALDDDAEPLDDFFLRGSHE